MKTSLTTFHGLVLVLPCSTSRLMHINISSLDLISGNSIPPLQKLPIKAVILILCFQPLQRNFRMTYLTLFTKPDGTSSTEVTYSILGIASVFNTTDFPYKVKYLPF